MNRRHFATTSVKLMTASLLGSGFSLWRTKDAIATPTWSYQGQSGPDHWGDLSSDYRLCAQGLHQSPIDLDTLPAEPVHWQHDYHPTPLKLTHDGHTIRADYAPGSSLTLYGERFELLQFHFHDPSEHSYRGQHQPMEIHFVHQQPQTQALAVVSVLVQAGASNPTLADLWQVLPQQAQQTTAPPQRFINAADLLPEHSTQAVKYGGSLTTPPCSEGVTWLVLTQTISATMDQINQFKASIGENARPTQATSRQAIKPSQER